MKLELRLFTAAGGCNPAKSSSHMLFTGSGSHELQGVCYAQATLELALSQVLPNKCRSGPRTFQQESYPAPS